MSLSFNEMLVKSKIGDEWQCKDSGLIIAHANNGFFEISDEGTKYPLILTSEILGLNCWEKLQKFKYGDWVYDPKYTPDGSLFIYQLLSMALINKLNESNNTGIRLATQEEIDTELERRAWEKVGRKVNEYRPNDVVLVNDVVYIVDKVNVNNYPHTVYVDVTDKSAANYIVEDDKVKLLSVVEQLFKI